MSETTPECQTCQETYLKATSTKDVAKRGIKKLLGDLTSVKFLLLIFVCCAIWFKIVGDTVGLTAALVIVGLREVPIDQIMAKIGGPK